jgi:hypothetical protein
MPSGESSVGISTVKNIQFAFKSKWTCSNAFYTAVKFQSSFVVFKYWLLAFLILSMFKLLSTSRPLVWIMQITVMFATHRVLHVMVCVINVGNGISADWREMGENPLRVGGKFLYKHVQIADILPGRIVPIFWMKHTCDATVTCHNRPHQHRICLKKLSGGWITLFNFS